MSVHTDVRASSDCCVGYVTLLSMMQVNIFPHLHCWLYLLMPQRDVINLNCQLPYLRVLYAPNMVTAAGGDQHIAAARGCG